MMASPPRRQRVPALSADERRAALIAATIPLLRQHGAAVTTRQIADAAGVAEGTIFGVFPDKSSLIRASVITALDATPLIDALREIKPTVDLRDRLVTVIELLQNRIAENAPLMHVVRATVIQGDVAWPPSELMIARQQMVLAIAEVIEPDRDRLRHPPEMTARVVQSIVMTSARGFFGEPDILTPRELVSLLLDGLLKQPGTQTSKETKARPQDVEQRENIRESPRADSTAA